MIIKDIVPNNLLTWNPKLASEWHPTKNGMLKPEDVTLHSGKKVWWICDKGHEWQATINHRSRGVGCPYCSGYAVCDDNCLAKLNKFLVKQWHPIKNGKLTPNDVTVKSNKKVWWVCDKGHEWQALVSSRSEGKGCPYCKGQAVCDDNCLANLNPYLASQWHPTKNGGLTPEGVTLHSGKKVWWVCSKGHEWQASINRRSRGVGCPYCAKNRYKSTT